MTLNRRTALAGLTAMALVSAQAHATDWPTKPVTIYVTTAAGGNTDLMARMAAEYLSAKFGKTFVVENRPSAGGAAASGPVVSAAPDGYTLLFTPNSAILLAPLVQKMNFDPDKSLTPVTNVGTGSQVVASSVACRSTIWRSSWLMPKPIRSKLNFAAAGTNNISHLGAAVAVRARRRRVGHGPLARRAAGHFRSDGRQRRFLLRQCLGSTVAAGPSGDQAAGGRHRAARLPSAPDLPTASETIPGLCLCVMERLSGAEWNACRHCREAPRRSDRNGQGAGDDGAPFGAWHLPGGQTAEQVAAVFRNDRRNFAEAVKVAGIPAP